MHLLRADIVNGDNEDGFVFFQQGLELVEVSGLVAGPAPHVFLEMKIGYLRVKVCVGGFNCGSAVQLLFPLILATGLISKLSTKSSWARLRLCNLAVR